MAIKRPASSLYLLSEEIILYIANKLPWNAFGTVSEASPKKSRKRALEGGTCTLKEGDSYCRQGVRGKAWRAGIESNVKSRMDVEESEEEEEGGSSSQRYSSLRGGGEAKRARWLKGASSSSEEEEEEEEEEEAGPSTGTRTNRTSRKRQRVAHQRAMFWEDMESDEDSGTDFFDEADDSGDEGRFADFGDWP